MHMVSVQDMSVLSSLRQGAVFGLRLLIVDSSFPQKSHEREARRYLYVLVFFLLFTRGLLQLGRTSCSSFLSISLLTRFECHISLVGSYVLRANASHKPGRIHLLEEEKGDAGLLCSKSLFRRNQGEGFLLLPFLDLLID